MGKLDIHNFELQYKSSLKCLENSTLSSRNKNLIKQFDKMCALEGIGLPRRIRVIGILNSIVQKHIKKNLDKVNTKDLKDVVLKLEQKQDYSVWTKHTYKSVLKKFFKWLKYGDNYRDKREYPAICSWIRTHVRRNERKTVQASDILTEDEVKKLIDVAEYPRDKAFISMLYELGARIGEIGTLRIKDVTRDDYSFIIDLRGKTGHRTPRIVLSGPYLAIWLNTHPDNDNPDAPLWVKISGTNRTDPYKYQSLRTLVKKLAKRAGIKKRVYPHLFRHTRVTHLLLNKQLNEAQAKVYFGWVPSSSMLSEYSHLVSSDVNEAILGIYGIKTKEKKKSKLSPKQCMCGAVNTKDAKFCNHCSNILDTKTAIQMDNIDDRVDTAASTIKKAMKKNKITDKDIKEIVKFIIVSRI